MENRGELALIRVYPWLELREPMIVCGVEFLPRAVAITRAGERAENVKAATSYFYSPFIMRPTGKPMKLEPVSPTVVFMNEQMPGERVDIATQVLCFSTLVANIENAGLYANATVFENHVQNLGPSIELYARRMRRMGGWVHSGAMIDGVLEVRPAWCGKFVRPNTDLMQALESVIFEDRAKPIREALESLMTATADADNVSPKLERSMYARAAERLLHSAGEPIQGRRQRHLARGKALLTPLMQPWGVASDGDQVMNAWDAFREHRNEYWHPDERTSTLYPFELQTAVSPNLIAFRMIVALVVATLVDLGALAPTSKIAGFAPAIELWIAAIQQNDARDSEDASHLGSILSSLLLKRAIVQAMTIGADDALTSQQ